MMIAVATKLCIRGMTCRAQTMTEYALIVTAVAVFVAIAYTAMGGTLTNMVTNIAMNL